MVSFVIRMVNASMYQRIRLWSGIVSIGSNLAIIVALYISAGWWAAMLVNPWLAVAVLGVIPFAIALANLPFEILVGHACESAAMRTRQSLKSWLVDWMCEASQTSIAQVLGLMFFYGVALLHGDVKWAIASAMGVGFLLVALRLHMLPSRRIRRSFPEDDEFSIQVIDELARLGVRNAKFVWVEQEEVSAVNGGILPFGQMFILSTTVRDHLKPCEVALLCAREHWMRNHQAGSRTATMIAVAWLIVGVGLALAVPAANAVQSALGGSAVISVWSFVALFVWPRLNHRWMRKGDHYLARLTTPADARSLLTKIQMLNHSDISLPATKAGVFHPIPPLQSRIESLP